MESESLALESEAFYKAHNFKRATQALEVLSNRGHAKSCFLLGRLYLTGLVHGGSMDETRAMSLFRTAYELGYAMAISQIGVCTFGGYGVEKDPEEGKRLFCMFDVALCAEELGDWNAHFLAGIGYHKGLFSSGPNIARAIHHYERAEAEGHVVAANNLALIYSEAAMCNSDLAVHYYEKVQQSGYPVGMANYAIVLDRRGEAGDQQKARSLLERAAAKKYAVGTVMLARFMFSGRGGPRDPVKGEEMLRELVAEENSDAIASLGVMLCRTGRFKEAIEQYEKLISLGKSFGYYNLGWMYMCGRGVKEDKQRGQELIEQASKLGCAKASLVLAGLCKQRFHENMLNPPARMSAHNFYCSTDSHSASLCSSSSSSSSFSSSCSSTSPSSSSFSLSTSTSPPSLPFATPSGLSSPPNYSVLPTSSPPAFSPPTSPSRAPEPLTEQEAFQLCKSDLSLTLNYYRQACTQDASYVDRLAPRMFALMLTLCEDWSPRNHKWYPKGARDSIASLMLLTDLCCSLHCHCTLLVLPREMLQSICTAIGILFLWPEYGGVAIKIATEHDTNGES